MTCRNAHWLMRYRDVFADKTAAHVRW